MLSGLLNTRKWEEWGMWHIWRWREIHTGFWWGKVKEGTTCMGRIVWSCGGMSWTRLWIFGSYRMLRISCAREERLASQKDSAPRDWLSESEVPWIDFQYCKCATNLWETVRASRVYYYYYWVNLCKILRSLTKVNRGTVVPVHTMKPYSRNGGIAPLFVTLALDEGESLTWRRGPLTPGKELRYPLNRKLGWASDPICTFL